MKIYYSGGLCIEKNDPYLVKMIRSRLLSYHYVTPGNTKHYWELKARQGCNLMLDSGAFSVWNKGKTVDFDTYLKYAVDSQDKWDIIIVLDQIPGSPGVKNVSLKERDHCATISWERYCIMKDAGIPAEKLMPVFHQGEHPKWMRQMIDKRCPLIGISPANDRTPEEKKVWLNDTMDIACDPSGKPLARFHGLAVTSPSLMRDYPWDSVDSATWAILPGNGGMMVPYYMGPGEYDFYRYHVVHTGKRSNKPDHIDTMSVSMQKQIRQMLYEAGFIKEEGELPDDRHLRMRVTTWFFDNLEKEISLSPSLWRSNREQSNFGLHL